MAGRAVVNRACAWLACLGPSGFHPWRLRAGMVPALRASLAASPSTSTPANRDRPLPMRARPAAALGRALAGCPVQMWMASRACA